MSLSRRYRCGWMASRQMHAQAPTTGLVQPSKSSPLALRSWRRPREAVKLTRLPAAVHQREPAQAAQLHSDSRRYLPWREASPRRARRCFRRSCSPLLLGAAAWPPSPQLPARRRTTLRARMLPSAPYFRPSCRSKSSRPCTICGNKGITSKEQRPLQQGLRPVPQCHPCSSSR